MTNEELNTALYEKMFEEQEQYRGWLLSQSPEEILNHTYEYTIREDILMSLEENDLSDKQCNALLASPTPLADVYKKWDSLSSEHMDEILSAIRCRANEVVRGDWLKERREAR